MGGVKITISGVKAAGGSSILTGSNITGGHTRIQIEDLTIANDAKLLDRMSVGGKNANVDIAIKGATMGDGSSVLNDIDVSGNVTVTASGLNVAKGATVMDGKIVGDGENVVVDLNGSNKGDDTIEVEEPPKKTEKRGLLSWIFGKKDRQGAIINAGKTSHKTTIQERISGNGEYRDPMYSQAGTGVGSQVAAEQDKGHMR